MTVNLILEGIVGSTAYNLAHKDSDIDKKGIFAHNTEELLKLHKPSDVIESKDPDVTWYEVAKWCNLALKCNPNILEILYLPDELYTHKTDVGDSLINLRTKFLSADRVRESYINYARSQLHQIENKGNFGHGMKNRTAKHARHLVRLMLQGYQLYTTGELTVRLDDFTADFVKTVGHKTAEGDLQLLKNVYEQYKQAFDNAVTVLPDNPDAETIESWLFSARKRFFNQGH